ncbi:MAG: zinc ABC transporter substrate-binding protein [Rickettsiales bacterium]|jgi:zinc/manganese transport system substrate-binding protein|nr:zinc ABC transporter substrate-binding protein [Rickettsiales bacterium]
MKKFLFIFLLLPGIVFAKSVFTCEPEWAALVQELDPAADIYSATTALQDPHVISAKPSLIARVRNADVIICTGAELEIGWLPVLLQKVGRSDSDVLYAANYVDMLEKPAVVSRSHGDVHPEGNPHVHLDPRNILPIADAIAARLGVEAEPFKKKWSTAMKKWEAQAKNLRGKRAITHHKNMAYLFVWLGMDEVGNLEPKPGIPPTAAHLSQLVGIEADIILYAPFENPDAAKWLAEKTGKPAYKLPFTVGEGAADLYALFENTIKAMKGE